MNIIYMGNNTVGLEVLRWLKEQGENIAALIVHPDNNARRKDEIIAAAALPEGRVLEADDLKDPRALTALQALQPDLILSVLFDYILKKDVLSLPVQGCVNLHNGYLPYNGGNFANVWSIIEGTPAGCTLHVMDEGIDTGPIIARQEVEVRPDDTGESLYRRTEQACLELFQKTWPRIKAGDGFKGEQQKGKGTYHKKGDVQAIDRIDLEKSYRAKDLINILRARTFSGYESAYMVVDGKKYFIRIGIKEEGNE